MRLILRPLRSRPESNGPTNAVVLTDFDLDPEGPATQGEHNDMFVGTSAQSLK
jgi:hypothetical protein